MKTSILVLIILLSVLSTTATAGDGMEFRFFGINPADFKDRNPVKVVIGGLASHIVHELGHITIGNIMDMDAEYDFADRVVYAEDYSTGTETEKALFNAGGFIATTIVGTVITAIPATRHSDYTLGFNGFSAIHDTMYGLTGGLNNEDHSDVYNLDNLGYDGTTIALTSGVYAGILTYISANKVK